MSTKNDVLLALRDTEAPDSVWLANQINSRRGTHYSGLQITSAVWDLSKQEYVTFEERERGGVKTPTRIRITERGRKLGDGAKPKEDAVATRPAPKMDAIAERLETAMLAFGEDRKWGPADLAKEINLDVKHPGGTVSMVLAKYRDRFARVGAGQWTLKIWAQPRMTTEPITRLGVDRTSLNKPTNGLVAPGGPITRDKVAVTAPVQHQNEKPALVVPATNGADLLAGLAHITALVEKAEKRAQMVEAARILEAAGEDELAIQTLSKVELNVLETEVVELVRRVHGEAGNASGQVHAGDG